MTEELNAMINSILFKSLIWNDKWWTYTTIDQPQCQGNNPWYTVARGLIYKNGWTLITAWISNDINHKVSDEITYPFSNFKGATIKIWNNLIISSHILLGMWLLIHAGLKLNHLSKKA